MKSMLIPFAAALLLSTGVALAQSEPDQQMHRHGMMMHKHDMPMTPPGGMHQGRMQQGGMHQGGMHQGAPGHEGHQGHEGQNAMTCPMMNQASMMPEGAARPECGQAMPAPTR
jgi:hypothetical protein